MSKRTDLAFKALAYLDRQGHSSGNELAEALEITANYLPQVLKPLVLAGWVIGTPGPGGGYQLQADLSGISVLDVVVLTEGAPENDRCVLRGIPCPAPEPCALHDIWEQARDTLLAELGSRPLAAALALAPNKGE